MAAWATPADVLEITGREVTEAQVAIAQHQIEVFVPLLDIEGLNPVDREYLRKTVTYQTVWLLGQIDVESRTDISSYGGDDSFTYSGPDGVVLAPLAKRCIDRCSWNRPGSIGRRATYPSLEALTDAVLRDEEPLTSMFGWRYEQRHL